MALRKVHWPCFQRCSQSVIPAIQKPHQRKKRHDLQYLVFVEVAAQFRELGIPYGVWRLTGCLREAQGRALGFIELETLLELP